MCDGSVDELCIWHIAHGILIRYLHGATCIAACTLDIFTPFPIAWRFEGLFRRGLIDQGLGSVCGLD